MSHAVEDRRTPASRERSERARRSIRGVNEARSLKPNQRHARQCRCDRPIVDSGDCLKCGLPTHWVACDDAVQAEFAEWCRREYERISRYERRGRTGR